MKKYFLFAIYILFFKLVNAQNIIDTNFTIIKKIPTTIVKNQAMTGTCWCFSSTSFIESQCIKNNLGTFDLSEMFIVRNAYVEKAKNYILRQGHAQFGEGGLGHDLINTISQYGAMPESAYSGLKNGNKLHNHQILFQKLKTFLDKTLTQNPFNENWLKEYNEILDNELGFVPNKFNFNGKEYNALSFAKDVLKFNPNEYISFTSFTHHPYYLPFVLEVPDNFSNGLFYNLPINEFLQLTKDALINGYSIVWDTDVSNKGFMQKYGDAFYLDSSQVNGVASTKNLLNGNKKEDKWDAEKRQKLFENLTTQDDHLMHLVGLEKSKLGNTFFLVKNSWGEIGPDKGFINVSESYFAINTISILVPKAALNKKLLDKLQIK